MWLLFFFPTDLCDRMKVVWRWSNSRLFQVTSPLSICQSHSREGEGMGGNHDWRDFLQNNTKSLAFSCSSPCTRETCHNPARLSRYPTAASGSNNELAPHVLSPVIFPMSCCSASNHSQHSWKIQGRSFMQRGTCHGIHSALLELAVCNPKKLNRKNSLWNHTCLRRSHVDAFMNIWRWINFLREMTDDLHSLSRATRSKPKDAHVQQICDSGLRLTFFVPVRKVMRYSCGRLVDQKKNNWNKKKKKNIGKKKTFNLNSLHVSPFP